MNGERGDVAAHRIRLTNPMAGIFYKVIVILCFAWGMAFPASGQSSLLNGRWEGIITQNEGGYSPEYPFELYLTVREGKVTGRSYVFIDDIFVIMEFSGKVLSNKMLILEESRIVDHRKTKGLEWCMKKMQLILKEEEPGQLILEGFWSGDSVNGPCIPGKIIVRQQIDRA